MVAKLGEYEINLRDIRILKGGILEKYNSS